MKSPTVLIDCGANKGQSMSALVKRFPLFREYKLSYTGYEPSVVSLPKKDKKKILLETTADHYKKKSSGFQLFPSTVGITKGWKLFWRAYGAGETGLIQKALNMFIRDLRVLKSKRSLRFFRVAMVNYTNLLALIQAYIADNIIVSLKLDIEGGEFIILENLLKKKNRQECLLVEYHGSKLGKPIEYLQDIHSRIFYLGIKINLWSAEDNPPHVGLGRELRSQDC